MASNSHWTAPPPPAARVPKLKYKNPVPPDQASLPSPTILITTADIPLQAQERPLTRESDITCIGSRQSFETTRAMSVSLTSSASTTSSRPSSAQVVPPKKKKANPVLGFFSLKEPSQVALEQFAQQQRKQAALKSQSPYSTSTGTFAGKRLPSDVPKVNSKWSGVPDVAKHQRGSSGSTMQKPRSSLSIGIRSWRPLSEPPKKSEFPVEELAALTTPTSVVSSAVPAPKLTGDVHDSVPEVRPTSPASSLNSVDTIVRDAAGVISKNLNYSPSSPARGEDRLAVKNPEEGTFQRLSDSYEPLSSPTSTEDSFKALPPGSSDASVHSLKDFSQPKSPRDSVLSAHRPSIFRSTPSDSTLPTLYESSCASTNSLATIKHDSDSKSIAPSSIAPSELSRRWYQSPQERLGLGGRLRLQNATPWDDGEVALDDQLS